MQRINLEGGKLPTRNCGGRRKEEEGRRKKEAVEGSLI
jgi:hypothetical protein